MGTFRLSLGNTSGHGSAYLRSVARPLSVFVIAEMLGVPPEDRERFWVWSAQRARLLEPTTGPRERAEDDGGRLSEREMLNMLRLLLIAGIETTANLIGNGMLALLRHPEQLRQLRNDPGLIRRRWRSCCVSTLRSKQISGARSRIAR